MVRPLANAGSATGLHANLAAVGWMSYYHIHFVCGNSVLWSVLTVISDYYTVVTVEVGIFAKYSNMII